MAWQSKVDRSNIHPGLVAVMDLAFRKLEKAATPFKAYSGLRTFEEQDELWYQGRDPDGNVTGKIVTKARGGQSMHNYGLAIDSAPLKDPNDPEGNVHWPDPDVSTIWSALHAATVSAAREIDEGDRWDGVDYEWGGVWRFRDVPHVQVRTTLGELRAGQYPYCHDVDWLIKAHTTFLFGTPWMLRRIQYLLNMQSYPCGTVDGVVGKRTAEAINEFQADQKLDVEKPGASASPAPAGGHWTIDEQTVERLVRLDHEGMSLPRGTLPDDLRQPESHWMSLADSGKSNPL